MTRSSAGCGPSSHTSPPNATWPSRSPTIAVSSGRRCSAAGTRRCTRPRPHCRPGHSDPAPYAPISTYLRLTNGIALSGADPDQADRLLILLRGYGHEAGGGGRGVRASIFERQAMAGLRDVGVPPGRGRWTSRPAAAPTNPTRSTPSIPRPTAIAFSRPFARSRRRRSCSRIVPLVVFGGGPRRRAVPVLGATPAACELGG
jgi:hypothetical protein